MRVRAFDSDRREERFARLDSSHQVRRQQRRGEVRDPSRRRRAVPVLLRLLRHRARVRVDRFVRGEAQDGGHLREPGGAHDRARVRVFPRAHVREAHDAAQGPRRLGEVRGHVIARHASVRVERHHPRLAAVLGDERVEIGVRQCAHGPVLGVVQIRRVRRDRRARRRDRHEQQREDAHRAARGRVCRHPVDKHEPAFVSIPFAFFRPAALRGAPVAARPTSA